MFAVVLCTTPSNEVEKLARPLVEEELVACVNVADVNSFFRWEGKLEEEKESLLIMKTKTDNIPAIIERIRELHSYDVPEIIALPIIQGNDGYLDWIDKSVT
ncbi:MAG: divalent-cation tolerance protein CutA [Chloroflexi bacterium]|jgi:periplasmic divalent cation tolerance protein|nr:divalent-cation tolerance protein CutA [Chloroflexota bacterium]